MIKSVHHTSITASDMEKSLRFYRDLLGMHLVKDVSVSGPDYDEVIGTEGIKIRVVYLELDHARIELTEYSSHQGKAVARDLRPFDHAIVHIALETDDIEQSYRELSSKGVSFISPPRWLRGGKGNAVAFFRDPDGISLELLQPSP